MLMEDMLIGKHNISYFALCFPFRDYIKYKPFRGKSFIIPSQVVCHRVIPVLFLQVYVENNHMLVVFMINIELSDFLAGFLKLFHEQLY